MMLLKLKRYHYQEKDDSTTANFHSFRVSLTSKFISPEIGYEWEQARKIKQSVSEEWDILYMARYVIIKQQIAPS